MDKTTAGHTDGGAPQPAGGTRSAEACARNKELVRRLIEDGFNAGRPEPIDDLFAPEMAGAAHRWVGSFRRAFPDAHMDIVVLVAESDTVAGWFRCSGTHLGSWQGHPPSGRRFEGVDEMYFFTVRDRRIASVRGLEDNDARVAQLRLTAPG